MESKAPPVDAADDVLICVDSHDKIIGFKRKFDCHTGEGILHRAFSVFLFNGRNEVLLQCRAPGKRLWPGYWSNSCCSHPRKDERIEDAADRRLMEELGVQPPVQFLYAFEYHARYLDQGSERELCSVAAGRLDRSPAANELEVSEWKFVDPDALDGQLAAHPERYTPWMKLEWARIRSEHWDAITTL